MQGQEMIAYIRREIHLVEKLIANMLIGTDIMTPEQFVFDFSKKTAFIGNWSYSFDLDMEIPCVSIQRPIYAKTKAKMLSYITQVISIYYLDIPHSREFFFQPDNVDFALLVHLVDADITGFCVENNIDKPIYIYQNFCLSQIQELTYPNIEQLHSLEAALANQISYNQCKKAWLKRVVGACYVAYEEQQEEKKVSLPVTAKINVVLLNGVIVCHFSKQTVTQLSEIVAAYESIWHDKGFTKLLKEN